MIKIIKQPDLHLTESELMRLRDEYMKMLSYYCGTPPSFEDWSRKQIEGTKQ